MITSAQLTRILASLPHDPARDSEVQTNIRDLLRSVTRLAVLVPIALFLVSALNDELSET